MDKEAAAKIIDYVVTVTKPRWQEWIHQRYEDLDDMFITRGYEQGGFQVAIFFDILKSKGIGSIYHLGKILDGYQGERKYSREEKGALEGKFYQDLKEGIYGEEGRKFYESIWEFLKIRKGNPGRNIWQILWWMLVCCRDLKNNYRASFKYYLKQKFAEFREVDTISDEAFCNITPQEWREFVKRKPPWNELYGISNNTFNYIIRDVDEFEFNKEAFKLDSANLYFLEVTGIRKAFDLKNEENIMAFLKTLGLKYSINEINSGIYTYCSESEKSSFGFCRNKERCLECKVYEYCERKIIETEEKRLRKNNLKKFTIRNKRRRKLLMKFLEQLITDYFKLLNYEVILDNGKTLIAEKANERILVKARITWGRTEKEKEGLVDSFKSVENRIEGEDFQDGQTRKKIRKIFIAGDKPEKVKDNSYWSKFQTFCSQNKIELISLNEFIQKFIDEVDKKYPKERGKVGYTDGLIRLFIHLSRNNFLNKYWRRVS